MADPEATSLSSGSSQHLHHVVVVRADLPHRVQVVQAVHAAGESTTGRIPDDTHALVFSVPDERSLLELADDLAAFHVTLILEPDAPWFGAAMALALRPQVRTQELKRRPNG